MKSPRTLILKRLLLSCLPFPVLLFSGAVGAQDFKNIEPKQVPSPGRSLKELHVASEPPDAAVRVKELKSIIFLTDPKSVKPEGVEPVSGLDVSRVSELQTESFKARMSKFIGKPVSLRSIEDLLGEVVAYYADNDRPFVLATSPEQDITTGVLQIVVVEGKVGEVKVVGAKTFDEKIYRNVIGLNPGEPIMKRKLDADIDWLNRNPFRDTSVLMQPGKTFGTTDVTVQTRELSPVRLYAGADDSGTDVTGNNRVLVGVNWGNAFGLGHQLNYQYTASPNFDNYRAHSATYIVPLSSRHLLTVFGAYVDTTGDTPAPFALKGHSHQVGLRYEFPLEKIDGLKHSLTGGLDYKRTNNNLEFGLAGVNASSTDVVQGVLSYDANLADASGTTAFTASAFYSPGGVTSDNTDRNFQALRAFAESRYAYLNVQIRRATPLAGSFSWHLSAQAQIASGNLLGSEQLGAGGYATVRGYNEYEANGDAGVLIRNELLTPSLRMGAPLTGKQAQAQLLAFLDYGMVSNKHLLPGEPQRVELSSVGLGVRFALDQNVSARFDYGWQLHDTGVPGGSIHSRPHFALVVSY